MCVRLLNATSREIIAETTTDSNGYYAFERPDAEVIVQFVKPDVYQFTKSNLGDEDHDSDADVTTGETQPLQANTSESFWDAGLTLSEVPTITPSPVVTGTPPNACLTALPSRLSFFSSSVASGSRPSRSGRRNFWMTKACSSSMGPKIPETPSSAWMSRYRARASCVPLRRPFAQSWVLNSG